MKVERLKRRPEFLQVAKGQRWNTPFFQLQAISAAAEQVSPRFGFTTTKRLGNAVVRNRIRRRLRAASAEVAGAMVVPGYDFVFVARPQALTCAYHDLKSEMMRAIDAMGRRLSSSRS